MSTASSRRPFWKAVALVAVLAFVHGCDGGVRIDLPDQPRVIVKNVDVFFKVAKAGFGQKRKQLHNSLAAGLPVKHEQIVQALNEAGIDPKRRPETLTLDEWGRLSDRLIGDRGSGIRGQEVLPAE